MKVDVLMPTLNLNGSMTADSLAHLPFDYDLKTTSVPGGWGHAMNDLLAKRDPRRDAIITDDDIKLVPDGLKDFANYYCQADIFGFLLLYPDTVESPSGPVTPIQHDGGALYRSGDQIRARHIFQDSLQPSLCGYVTTSFCYVKSHVFKKVTRFYEWPGIQWEDVAFCVEAQKEGLKVAYVPCVAIHAETQTKRKTEGDLARKYELNAQHFNAEVPYANYVVDRFNNGRLPLGN